MESKCCHRGSKNLSDLPLDIIFNIFSKLPADVLIGLRSVCKLWNKLIRDPYFIDLHLSAWMHRPPSRLVVAPLNGYPVARDLVFVDGIEEGHWRRRKIKVKYFRGMSFMLFGSCNGLLCMGSSDPRPEFVFICNPITGETMCLPKSNLAAEILGLRMAPLDFTTGFGFDHATKKYKVVRLLFYWKDDRLQDQYQLLVEILTIGESSWRKLDVLETNDQWYHFSPMMFSNGLVFWISDRNWGVNGYEFILAFDIGSEKITIINVPCLEQEKFRSRLMKMENGSLALVTVHSKPKSGGIKISKIWRIVGSMATGFSLEKCENDVSSHCKHGTVYAWLSVGTLLLKQRRRNPRFALYHPTKNQLLQFPAFQQAFDPEPVLFMPSLVSLSQ